MGTGKANGSKIVEKSPRMFAATEEQAILKQQQFIDEYLHPKVSARTVEHTTSCGSFSAFLGCFSPHVSNCTTHAGASGVA